MFRFLALIIGIVVAPTGALAHEFWIEPDAFVLPAGSAMYATVRIGSDLDGKAYPFEPRAYRFALWSGPGGERENNRLPLDAPALSCAGLATACTVFRWRPMAGR